MPVGRVMDGPMAVFTVERNLHANRCWTCSNEEGGLCLRLLDGRGGAHPASARSSSWMVWGGLMVVKVKHQQDARHGSSLARIASQFLRDVGGKQRIERRNVRGIDPVIIGRERV
jgi:hypothetical protein